MPIENLDSHPAHSRPIPVWLHTASSGFLGFVVGVMVSLPGSGPVSGDLSEPADPTHPAEQVRDPLRSRRADAARLQGQALCKLCIIFIQQLLQTPPQFLVLC